MRCAFGPIASFFHAREGQASISEICVEWSTVLEV
jgi:hypothetical protein